MARSAETPTDDADDLGALSYREATQELEAILAELEGDDVDIDQLSRQVQRAAALIRLCQERITGARLEVEHVVADLAALAATPSTGPGDGGRGDDDDGDDGDDRDADEVDHDADGVEDDLDAVGG